MLPVLVTVKVPVVRPASVALASVAVILTVVAAVKVAVTDLAADMVTEQVPVPVQLPLQPAKVEPVAGAAVKVTTVPLSYGSEQSAPQLTPAGLLVTVPLPVPALVTVSV